MAVNAKNELSIFIELGFICLTTSMNEAELQEFFTCKLHPYCGILKNIHFGIRGFQKAFSDMKSAVHEKIFHELLFGKVIKSELLEKVMHIIDYMNRSTMEY